VLLAAAIGLCACGASASHSTSVGAVTSSRTSAARVSSTVSAAVPPGPIVAVLRAPGHHPRVGNWEITLTLTKGGRPIAGHVSYQYLFQGQVVSTQQVGGHSPDFVGVFHDTLTWPATAVGYPLTFRVVITTPYGVKNVDYAVTVRR
jgi:hypothetical protein